MKQCHRSRPVQPSRGHLGVRGRELCEQSVRQPPVSASVGYIFKNKPGGPVPLPTLKGHTRVAPAVPHADGRRGVANPMFGHLAHRTATIAEHFPAALSAGDFLSRAEIALAHYGFRGDNSIAVTNLCRDEATAILKDKIDTVFGANFNINGLGAGLTCGCLGLSAGFSHSPVVDGRERYIFFSMPHIAIDSEGHIGSLYRPGRAGGPSTACGALVALLSQFKGDPRAVPRYAAASPSSHSMTDPELSILRNRLARHLVRTGADVASMYLAEFTQQAERAITADLEDLIHETVNINVADYAVVTGVQVHSWPAPESGEPLLEFVAPRLAYVLRDGVRTPLELQSMPALTPRQLAVLRRTPPEWLAAEPAGTTIAVESKLRGRSRP